MTPDRLSQTIAIMAAIAAHCCSDYLACQMYMLCTDVCTLVSLEALQL